MKNIRVTAGNVLLKMLPYKPTTVIGMEAPTTKRKPYDEAVVVKIGKPDGLFEMDELIVVGAKFMVGFTSILRGVPVMVVKVF